MIKRQLFKLEVSNANLDKKRPHQRNLNKHVGRDQQSSRRYKQVLSFSLQKHNQFESSSKRIHYSRPKRQTQLRTSANDVPEANFYSETPSNIKKSFKSGLKQQSTLKQYKLKIKEEFTKECVNSTSRIILIDWLAEACNELQISKEALQVAIFYLDKLNSKITISKPQYQHLGLTCLLLSHKIDSRKTISLEAASDLVEGSLPTAGFVRNQIRVVSLLNFRLRPFTLWQEIRCILAGFQMVIIRGGLLGSEWGELKRKMVWIAEGITLQLPHVDKRYLQSNFCLKIIEIILKQWKYNQIYTKFQEFCLIWLQKTMPEIGGNQQQLIAYWASSSCTCSKPYNEDSYHPELKCIANKCMISI